MQRTCWRVVAAVSRWCWCDGADGAVVRVVVVGVVLWSLLCQCPGVSHLVPGQLSDHVYRHCQTDGNLYKLTVAACRPTQDHPGLLAINAHIDYEGKVVIHYLFFHQHNKIEEGKP